MWMELSIKPGIEITRLHSLFADSLGLVAFKIFLSALIISNVVEMA
jgi:hypothetical protein